MFLSPNRCRTHSNTRCPGTYSKKSSFRQGRKPKTFGTTDSLLATYLAARYSRNIVSRKPRRYSFIISLSPRLFSKRWTTAFSPFVQEVTRENSSGFGNINNAVLERSMFRVVIPGAQTADIAEAGCL